MCGFLGVYAPRNHRLEAQEETRFRSASDLIQHRGSTGQGFEFGSDRALFHYRLAFRDLTEGTQPMRDAQGRATILFNGELYDFHPLRKKLSRSFEFRTRSDTEVILAAYLVYGKEMLRYLDGEYAFSIQDHRDGSVVAARDPFGVKPLFWSGSKGVKNGAELLRHYQESYELRAEGRLHFASEVKGLALPLEWEKRGLTRQMLSLYEEMGTAFRDVFALPPGALFTATPDPDGWSVRIERKIPRRTMNPSTRSFEERAQELKALIEITVRNKMDSEVPLGAYLSGGIDSRIVAYEMGRLGATVETFTVGFEGADYDESVEVKKFLANTPNLKGRVLRTSNEALLYAYPHAIYASELVQPYTNGAAKWWLSRFARRHVRGVLTGDGADELFCGYPSYRYLAWWKFFQRHPSPARLGLYEARVVGKREKFWEKGLSSRYDGSDLLESQSRLGWAHPLFAQIRSVGFFLLGSRIDAYFQEERADLASFAGEATSPLGAWRDYFLHTHFPTHVLNWVGDRMEMANTLEGRPIYLSRALLDFARASPDGHLVRGLRDKAILRKAYAEPLGAFASAPKKQFNAPFLQAGAREFLNSSALRESGLFDPKQVEKAFTTVKEAQDPLERSFAEIFLQNCLVTQMLDRYLVRRSPPVRDLAFEERFLDEKTEELWIS